MVAATESDSQVTRLFLDISMLVRWSGAPVGIFRVEIELARYALTNRPDIEFVFFDSRTNVYRILRRDVVQGLITDDLVVDLTGLPDPRPVQQSRLSALLRRFDRRLFAVRRPRRFLVQNLERLRLATPAGALKDAIGTAQARLFNARYRSLFFDASGRRRAFLPLDRALGHSAQLGPDCTILVAGAEWNTKDPAVIRDLKQKTAYRLVMVCHDLIPILFPQFYIARDAQVFANYYRQAVGFVDRFVSVSHCTARDLARFADAQAASPDIRVEPPGMKLPTTSGKPHELPRLLTPRRFILFVSTIEPRKNHALLYRAWLRLIERGIVAARGYKLVFVGRPGWHTESLMAEISADARVADSLVYLREPSDDVLAQLYTDAAFCVYPSIYEGFGLPVTEALAYGRAVIGSTGGSIPEVLGQLGPCLDATDEDAWFATLERFMSDDEAVRACEARVRAEFRPITWQEAAARYFRHATDQFDANPKPSVLNDPRASERR